MDASETMDAVVETASAAEDAWGWIGPLAEIAREHWLTLVLTGEIIGAVVAIKFRHYYRGTLWLIAALATVWAGALR